LRFEMSFSLHHCTLYFPKILHLGLMEGLFQPKRPFSYNPKLRRRKLRNYKRPSNCMLERSKQTSKPICKAKEIPRYNQLHSELRAKEQWNYEDC
jgi:hypothetical protein